MPIREIRTDDLDQECAKCGAINTVADGDIAAGVVRESNTNTNLVALPVCPVCGSAEFLLRSPDQEDEYPSQGSYGHKHKLLVDKLHAKLVGKGRVANGLNAGDVPTKEPPAAVMDKWFSDGLKLPPPPFQDGEEPPQ